MGVRKAKRRYSAGDRAKIIAGGFKLGSQEAGREPGVSVSKVVTWVLSARLDQKYSEPNHVVSATANSVPARVNSFLYCGVTTKSTLTVRILLMFCELLWSERRVSFASRLDPLLPSDHLRGRN